MCGRPLCLACATPVRGRLIGPECLPKVLESPPGTRSIPTPISHRGDQVAAAGFVVVLALSVFPWSRGLVSGVFSAWSVHWSLAATSAAAIGVAASLVAWRRARRVGLETALEAVMALATGAATALHASFPPSLSEPTIVPVLALLGAAIALWGALGKTVAVRRAGIEGGMP